MNIDESSLTGESYPVVKKKNKIVYAGTVIKRGRSKAVVIATGPHTRYGRTVKLVEEAGRKSHFYKVSLHVGYFLLSITLFLVGIIVAISFFRNEEFMNIMMFAFVLIIAGIPQALPAVLSVNMYVGSNRLARNNALVSRLSSLEEMAGLKILFTDKTGTLTKNELELQDPVLIDAENNEEIMEAATLAIQNDRKQDDSFDKAIRAGLKNNNPQNELKTDHILFHNPTDQSKEAELARRLNDIKVVKGDARDIMNLMESDPERMQKIIAAIKILDKKGYRSFGIGKKQNNRWYYLGILPFLDPPRQDSKISIQQARNWGIDIRMITGDVTAVGKEIARQVGLGTNIVAAGKIFNRNSIYYSGIFDKNSSGNISGKYNSRIMNADGFAEVKPEHKYRIIRYFQDQNIITGMTGDGINDAPALKQADIGIAVSGALDAARSAADLILTTPGLSIITKAIEESRSIFKRMNGYVKYRMIETMRVLLFMGLSILAFRIAPVTPTMIVFLAILNDIPIMAIASDKVQAQSTPVRWDMKKLKYITSIMCFAGVLSSTLLLWYLIAKTTLSAGEIQTMIFLKLLVSGHLTIFLTRNEGWFWQRPLPHWILFSALEITQLIGTLFAVYGWLFVPIGWVSALIVWIYSVIWLVILNGIKLLALNIYNKLNLQAKPMK